MKGKFTRATSESEIVVLPEYARMVESFMKLGSDELTAKAEAMDFMLPRSIVRNDFRKRLNPWVGSLKSQDVAKEKGCNIFSVNKTS